MPSSFYEVVSARPVMFATSAANLRAEPSAKYVQGQQVFVGATGVQLSWDAASLAVDNGTTVIKPNDILVGNPGRFVALPGGGAGLIARTLFVDGGSTEPTENGAIETPFKTIQAAVNATSAVVGAVWQIVIAPGSYAESPIVPADREIVMQPFVTEGAPYGTTPISLAGGDVFWNPAGSLLPASLMLRGFLVGDVNIDNVPAAAGSPTLEMQGCAYDGITDAPGAPFTGTMNLVYSSGSTLTAMSAVVRSTRCAFTSAVNIGALIDDSSTFNSFLTLNGVGVAGVLRGTSVVGPLSVPAGEVWMDGQTTRVSASLGGLPTPASGGANIWRGDAGYYSLHHTVRQATTDVAANLGDEYIALDPPALTTRTVTLPAAALFAASANELNGGVTRRPARHLTVRNVNASTGTGIVAFATLGTDVIDGAAASGFIMLPGESCTLVPVLQGAVWNWMPLRRFGRNYMSAVSAGVSSSVVAVYATKVSLASFPLRGIYRVSWRAIVSASNVNTDIQARLFNATDAVQIGSICRANVNSTVQRVFVGGSGLVSFTGTSKTFDLEWQRPAGTGNADIEDAQIELWRVA